MLRLQVLSAHSSSPDHHSQPAYSVRETSPGSMMPLEELSVNVQRARDLPREKFEDDERPSSTAPPPPRAVQSMLKTTTELGDLGQLGIGPSRLSRSGSRLQTSRARSGSLDASFASSLRHQRSPYLRHHSRHHGPRPVHSTSTLWARQSSRSNLSSYAHSTRTSRHHHSQHPYPLQGLTSPSPSLYTHRSLVTLRSNRDVYSVRSASPIGPPHRFRGPYHRPASPGFADDRPTHAPHPGFIRAPSVGTVASSPRSIHPRRGPLLSYGADFSGSYTSLSRVPSAAYPYTNFSLHSGTPVPSLRGGGPFSGSATSLAGIPQSPSGSTTPAYYDYSESFAEEHGFQIPERGNTEASAPTMSQIILEDVPTPFRRQAQTPFGIKKGSMFQPIELPTKHNRRPSEHSRNSSKPNSRHSARRSLNGTVPQLGLGPERPATSGSSTNKHDVRRTRSEDNRSCDTQKVDLRRKSTVVRRAMAPSPSGGFFSSANRSPRDLALLAARVHSTPPNAVRKSRPHRQKSNTGLDFAKPPGDGQPNSEVLARNVPAKHSPLWQLPAMTFRPISLTPYSPQSATRPKTSQATSANESPDIHSPMPKRPMSSQSRKRFSRILDIDVGNNDNRYPPSKKENSCRKEPSLTVVAENPQNSGREQRAHMLRPGSASSTTSSSAGLVLNTSNETDVRISEVTSHDKSTVESLLDKHIECLGLQPEGDPTLDFGDTRRSLSEPEVETDDTTIRLTDILAQIPHAANRPMTSTSQQYSSLATLDRKAMKPRRLFASMDARVPGTIEEQSLTTSPWDRTGLPSRPSHGWQTLPSTSRLRISTMEFPTLESGELGDVDISETRTKLRVKRRSLVGSSTSDASDLSTLSLALTKSPCSYSLHKRSKSDLVTRQASHRRRRLRIRLKLKAKSSTTGDLISAQAGDDIDKRQSKAHGRPPLPPRISSIKSPVDGYAELSGDSVPVSQTNLQGVLTRSPPIPARWSSIIAAMPQPVKRTAELARKASIRTQRSQRSNGSVVEPINTSHVHGQIPGIGNIPQLAPPDFGPPLTSSDLNLSIPYAAAPSTIRPTLRETKSFFSDDSSANRQRKSLRRKLHLHSLRNVVSSSAGTSMITHTPHSNNGLKLSHSCQMNLRDAAKLENSPADTIPMTDFAYRKRRMLEKLRDWWNRQCLQKMVSGRNKKEKGTPELAW